MKNSDAVLMFAIGYACAKTGLLDSLGETVGTVLKVYGEEQKRKMERINARRKAEARTD